ncbi:MAG TPA: hypothetical protein VIF82_16895 [Burkholderiaceae bacterium]|jgi:hypothetical protein
MDSNPYAPPTSILIDHAALQSSETSAPVFFPVSVVKLLIMSLCTLGMYEYYWFYKNWKAYRSHSIEDISPFWRAMFPLFFCYSLFDRVRKYNPDSSAANLLAGPLATAWIISSLLWKLPNAYWLVTFMSILALLPVQASINVVNQIAAPAHEPNSRFTVWNWIAVGLGGPFLLLAVYGTFITSK